jgi:hypothetical protein
MGYLQSKTALFVIEMEKQTDRVLECADEERGTVPGTSRGLFDRNRFLLLQDQIIGKYQL